MQEKRVRDLAIEVGVQNANLSNAINRQVVPFRGAANGFGRRCVVSAKGFGAVCADVRVKPRHALFLVNQRKVSANLCAFFIDGKVQTFSETSFNYVARHGNSSSSCCELSIRRGIYRDRIAWKSGVIPILERRTTYFGKGRSRCARKL